MSLRQPYGFQKKHLQWYLSSKKGMTTRPPFFALLWGWVKGGGEYINKDLNKQEDMARYAGLLLAPAEGKNKPFYAVLAHFWRFLVSSSNRGNI